MVLKNHMYFIDKVVWNQAVQKSHVSEIYGGETLQEDHRHQPTAMKISSDGPVT